MVLVTAYGTDSQAKFKITPEDSTKSLNTRFRLTGEVDSGITYDTMTWYSSNESILKFNNASTIYATFDALQTGTVVVYCILFNNGAKVLAASTTVTIENAE